MPVPRSASNRPLGDGGEPPGRVDVVIPAAGTIDGEFALKTGVSRKALLRFNGRSILERTLEALRTSGRINRIVVVGPDDVQDIARGYGAEGLPGGSSGSENVLKGLLWLGEHPDNAGTRALIVAADLPFLTRWALCNFLDQCPGDADIVVSVVTESAFTRRFPGSPGVFNRLRDGSVTNGCVFLVNPQTLIASQQHLKSVFEARKSQWRLARLIGLRIALRFLTRRLTLHDLVCRVERILQCRGAVVPDSPPEVAMDIDSYEDYCYALACEPFCSGNAPSDAREGGIDRAQEAGS